MCLGAAKKQEADGEKKDPVDETIMLLMREVKVMERRFERIDRIFRQVIP